MQENNSSTFLNISWTAKNQKKFVYKLKPKAVLGLGVSFDGDNYRNWKKLLYNIDNFSSSTEILSDNTNLSIEAFLKSIKLCSPRPLDKIFESSVCSDVYSYLHHLNMITNPIDHSLLSSNSDLLWKNLATHKKVMLQILCSMDFSKKLNFIFLEKMTFPEQHQSFITETLKHVASKYDMCIVILGQNKSLPQISWLPLLPAPLEQRHFTKYTDEEEDYDEAAS